MKPLTPAMIRCLHEIQWLIDDARFICASEFCRPKTIKALESRGLIEFVRLPIGVTQWQPTPEGQRVLAEQTEKAPPPIHARPQPVAIAADHCVDPGQMLPGCSVQKHSINDRVPFRLSFMLPDPLQDRVVRLLAGPLHTPVRLSGDRVECDIDEIAAIHMLAISASARGALDKRQTKAILQALPFV